MNVGHFWSTLFSGFFLGLAVACIYFVSTWFFVWLVGYMLSSFVTVWWIGYSEKQKRGNA